MPRVADDAGQRVVEFGRTLRRLRAERALSQEALAAQAGLSPQHVSNIERGNKDLRLSTVLKLAEALEIPLGAFEIDGSEQPAPSAPAGERSHVAPRPAGDDELRALTERVERIEELLLDLRRALGKLPAPLDATKVR